MLVFDKGNLLIPMNGSVRPTIESTVQKKLASSRPSWVVKNVLYDPAALYSRMHGPGFVISSRMEKIEKDLADLAATHGVDALLVFTPSKYNEMSGQGASVSFPSMTSYIGRGTAYGNVAVHMINPRGTSIGHAYSAKNLTYKDVDVSEYEIRTPLMDNMKPEVIKQLRVDIIEVLRKNVDIRLTELGL